MSSLPFSLFIFFPYFISLFFFCVLFPSTYIVFPLFFYLSHSQITHFPFTLSLYIIFPSFYFLFLFHLLIPFHILLFYFFIATFFLLLPLSFTFLSSTQTPLSTLCPRSVHLSHLLHIPSSFQLNRFSELSYFHFRRRSIKASFYFRSSPFSIPFHHSYNPEHQSSRIPGHSMAVPAAFLPLPVISALFSGQVRSAPISSALSRPSHHTQSPSQPLTLPLNFIPFLSSLLSSFILIPSPLGLGGG